MPPSLAELRGAAAGGPFKIELARSEHATTTAAIGHCLTAGDGLQIACRGCDHNETWDNTSPERFRRGLALMSLAAFERGFVCPEGRRGALVEVDR